MYIYKKDLETNFYVLLKNTSSTFERLVFDDLIFFSSFSCPKVRVSRSFILKFIKLSFYVTRVTFL